MKLCNILFLVKPGLIFVSKLRTRRTLIFFVKYELCAILEVTSKVVSNEQKLNENVIHASTGRSFSSK